MSFNVPNTICRQSRLSSRAGGFTMIELLITLTIAIILAVIAVPQYADFTQARRTTSEITSLSNDMQLARTEAIKEGQTVTLCVSSNQTSCTGTLWSQGWIIFSDPNSVGAYTAGGSQVLLKAQTGLTSSDTIATLPTASVAVLQFNRDGFAVNVSSSSGILFQLHTSPSYSPSTRCLWIGSIGNQFIQTTTSTAQTGQGTNLCT